MAETGTDVCMVFSPEGNAYDSFDYTPDALEARALALRKERGEISTVTYGPSSFIQGDTGGNRA